MTVIPNRGLYTLLLQHAIKRCADTVREFDLDYLNPEHQQFLLDYITRPFDYDFNARIAKFRGSTPVGPAGKTNPRNVPGRAKKLRESLARVQNKSADVREGGTRTEGQNDEAA